MYVRVHEYHRERHADLGLRSWPDPYALRPTFGGWYFPSPQGMRYDPDNFSSDLARVHTAQGIVRTCLDYRHTFGSQLAMKGESLYKIATLMGNSPEICRRHYAALPPTEMGTTVEFLEQPTAGFGPWPATK